MLGGARGAISSLLCRDCLSLSQAIVSLNTSLIWLAPESFSVLSNSFWSIHILPRWTSCSTGPTNRTPSTSNTRVVFSSMSR